MQTVGIIDRAFNWSRVRHAQLAAPVLAEREQYLAYLLENGVNRPSVRSTACILMHLVRLLDLHSMPFAPTRAAHRIRPTLSPATSQAAHSSIPITPTMDRASPTMAVKGPASP
jgi:hypothetical protein